MIKHAGRCFCDWQSRRCPCPDSLKDLARFNGNCLCNVLQTPSRNELYRKTHSAEPRAPKPEDKKLRKERTKKAKALFAKISGKRKKGKTD